MASDLVKGMEKKYENFVECHELIPSNGPQGYSHIWL